MTDQALRSALVTGGASGIGRASALMLAREGWAVTVADRDAAGAEAVAEEIRYAGGRALSVACDVTDEASVRAAVHAAVEAHGGLTAAINSAGVAGASKPLHELDAADFELCNGINLRGMFLSLKYEIAAMLRSGGGAVVAVSSAAATKGLVNSADYCAAKAGVLGLVRGAAVDYADQGVRVNAILPGGTATPLAMRSSAANPKLAQTVRIPIGRMASPDEVAAACVWLVSDAASYVTGAMLPVDGAMTAA